MKESEHGVSVARTTVNGRVVFQAAQPLQALRSAGDGRLCSLLHDGIDFAIGYLGPTS